MNKVVQLCLVIVFIFPYKVQCQDFAPIGATWYYTNLESFFNTNLGFEKIEVIKDTLINEKPTKVLAHSLSTTRGEDLFLRNEYLYINEDTIYRLAEDGEFYILYNFNAAIGDSWTSKSFSYTFEEEIEYIVTVTDITNRMINDVNTIDMQYSTSDDMHSFADRGVNSLFGGEAYFYPEDYVLRDGDIRYGLRCFQSPDDDALKLFEQDDYVYPIVVSCSDLITNTNDLLGNTDINIYPNPSTGIVNIELNNFTDESAYLELFSVTGKLILEQKVKNVDQLNINQTGTFIVQIISDNKIVSRLIEIQ